jgi:DNA-directed RNA polymerase beta subunit
LNFLLAVKDKKKRKSILIKIRLIGWIAMDYLIDLFNRNSRDYREVSRQLGEMKSEDKIIQQERIRAETSVGAVNEFFQILQSSVFLSRLPLLISIKWLVVIIRMGKTLSKDLHLYL